MSIPRTVKSVQYNVHLAELEREDNLLMALKGITEQEDTFFQFLPGKENDRIFTGETDTRLQIIFEINDEVTLFER